MDSVILSCDSAILSCTVSIESLAHCGQFSDLSIKSEVISIPSSINVGVFSIKLLTCFVIGGPTIARVAHSNASRSRKIMSILLHLGNFNFSSNVCKGTVKYKSTPLINNGTNIVSKIMRIGENIQLLSTVNLIMNMSSNIPTPHWNHTFLVKYIQPLLFKSIQNLNLY